MAGSIIDDGKKNNYCLQGNSAQCCSTSRPGVGHGQLEQIQIFLESTLAIKLIVSNSGMHGLCSQLMDLLDVVSYSQ
jgi:hypothetical protein